MAFRFIVCVALVFAGLVALSAASNAVPKPCCVNSQSVVDYVLSQGTNIGSSVGIFAVLGNGTLAMDFKKGMAGAEITARNTIDGSITSNKIIADYNKNIVWVINGRICNKVPFNGDPTPRCIPDNAEYLGQGYMGDGQIQLNTWRYTVMNKHLPNSYANVTFSGNKACTPVSSSAVIILDGQVYSVTANSFSNYRNAIADPSRWFTVPRFCPKEFTDKRDAGINYPVVGFFGF